MINYWTAWSSILCAWKFNGKKCNEFLLHIKSCINKHRKINDYFELQQTPRPPAIAGAEETLEFKANHCGHLEH
jgi:hypothetical protein